MYDTEERELTKVEQAVYLVYLELAKEDGDWIRIARIHQNLDYHPDAITDAINSLIANQDAIVAPESNTKVLTPEDHDAAIWNASAWCHLIVFED